MRAIWLVLLMIALSGCCPWCGRKEYNEAKAKMTELCAKDGGITVFETVQLPPGARYTSEGYPTMYDYSYGMNYGDQLGSEYSVVEERQQLLHADPKIKLIKQVISVIRKSDRKILGQTIRYVLVDGYAVEGTGGGDEVDCPANGVSTMSLYRHIFVVTN